MKHKAYYLNFLLLCCALLTAFQSTSAQDTNLILHYDFENISGTTVPDLSSSGINATLRNQAKVVEMGKYHVMDLGNGTGYLDMTANAGNLLRSTDNYTISMYYRIDENASLSGNGFFLWTFSTSTACTATAGKYTAYRLNAQRFATSTGGYNNEIGLSLNSESEKAKWIHVAYKQSGTVGYLYLNGVLKGSQTGMPLNSTNFTSSLTYSWIGCPPFSGDNYLKQTLVYDVRIYDKALTAEEITSLANITTDLDYEFRYGTPGDFTRLKTAIDDANSFLKSEDLSKYPSVSVEEYKDAINMGQTLLDEGKVNQDIINEQVTALNSAKTKLKSTAGFVFDDSDATSGYDTERGFKHPGGLHTAADFERVKSQIHTNSKVTSAYNVLLNAEYSQSTIASYPVETIVRGGGVGENYINAARGATMAYQNALRWKIDGTEDNARKAIEILNAWARTTKSVSGDSNYALASGLYGYQFANAAELMRDYDGWSESDFNTFKQWMLKVWYPPCIGFLRGRNGTWENAGRWWQAPGHYWSNWGLCNVLAVISIGILCDDVFIYNQGMSFFKYDQVGTFRDPRTANPILNDGLTEFLGNLVVTTTESDLETGAYGKLGQMQESGRDVGHAVMAAGLAVDIAHVGWNQGDDLFSFMDHRLAAGIEYIAAQNLNTSGLPWTNYHYGESGLHWSDGRTWLQTAPALGEQIRPYWGTVIGHYEGIKGVEMPFSKKVYNKMGIDGGGAGSTSGGYDHLGYSVLMNTYNGIASAEKIPTPITPKMQYNGKMIVNNELGGLTNTYTTNVNTGVAKGSIITLIPQLPANEDDSGKWVWNTGEKTKDLTIVADKSFLYRVTYTNQNGVESEQVFVIAVQGDCEENIITPAITYAGNTINTNEINVLYGSEVTLAINGGSGFCKYQWENSATTNTIQIPNITSSREISAIYTNQGGRKQKVTFRINVLCVRPDFIVNGTTYTDSTLIIVSAGEKVVLTPSPSGLQQYGTWKWNDGSTEKDLTIENIQTSGEYTVQYTLNENQTESTTYRIYVQETDYHKIENGTYYILHKPTNTYLTNRGDGSAPVFSALQKPYTLSQQWDLSATTTSYSFQSLLDDAYLNKTGEYAERQTKVFRFIAAVGSDEIAIRNNSREGNVFWDVDANGNINFAASETVKDFMFELIPIDKMPNGIQEGFGNKASVLRTEYYTLNGIKLTKPQKGINIKKTIYSDGRIETSKILVND